MCILKHDTNHDGNWLRRAQSVSFRDQPSLCQARTLNSCNKYIRTCRHSSKLNIHKIHENHKIRSRFHKSPLILHDLSISCRLRRPRLRKSKARPMRSRIPAKFMAPRMAFLFGSLGGLDDLGWFWRIWQPAVIKKAQPQGDHQWFNKNPGQN